MENAQIQKLYYSISEVADMLDLEPHVLRYWESEFKQLQPKKNRAGRRAYRESDIDMLRIIKRLLKEDKYTIEGARQVLNRQDRESLLQPSVKDELLELRSFLSDLLKTL